MSDLVFFLSLAIMVATAIYLGHRMGRIRGMKDAMLVSDAMRSLDRVPASSSTVLRAHLRALEMKCALAISGAKAVGCVEMELALQRAAREIVAAKGEVS